MQFLLIFYTRFDINLIIKTHDHQRLTCEQNHLFRIPKHLLLQHLNGYEYGPIADEPYNICMNINIITHSVGLFINNLRM